MESGTGSETIGETSSLLPCGMHIPGLSLGDDLDAGRLSEVRGYAEKKWSRD